MSIFGRLAGIRTVAPVICTSQPRRCKVVDVKDVVQWKFVEKPSPHTASYSGDLGVNEPVDLTQPQFAVKPALDVLNRSDEVTQRVLSLEFARGVEKTKYLEERAVARIQRHRFDTESPEAKIARLTVKIREFQRRLMTPEGAKEGGPMRRHVHNMTWRRSGLLRQLRAADYRRFEWVLDQVEVIYRPPLPPGTDTTLTRKSGIRRMVKIFCDNIRQEKLDSLRRRLDAEKPAFERERRAAVEWIAEEERALGLPPSVDLEGGRLLEPRLQKRVVVPPRRGAASA